MRILFLSHFPLFGNGSGNYTRKLGQELVKNGHIVGVVAPGSNPVEHMEVFPLNPAQDAVFFSHPEWKGAPQYSELNSQQITEQYRSFLASVVAAVERFQPDVIHVNHCFMLSWVANYIRAAFGIGYVVTAHGTGILQATSDRRYFELTRQALERANGLLPVSNHTRKWLLKAFGVSLKHKTRIVPAGIPSDAFTKVRSVKTIEEKYNLKGKKVVLFVGRLTPEKGVEYLIRAAKDIQGEIFIIGGGSYKEKLQKLSEESGAENIHFIGYLGKEYIQELREFYARADVLVLPSVVEESLGLVILEAMAAKTPVVASNKGGIPLAVKERHTGFLVRARSAKAIAARVNQILQNEELAHRLGHDAQAFIRERFVWDVLAPKVEAVYEWAYSTTKRLKHRRSYFDESLLTKERKELGRSR